MGGRLKSDGFIRIKFPIKSAKEFSIESNFKEEKIIDVISEYLKTVIGAGKDNSQPAEIDVYEIVLNMSLETDSFFVQSNVGNRSLRDGIVGYVLHELVERKKNAFA